MLLLAVQLEERLNSAQFIDPASDADVRVDVCWNSGCTNNALATASDAAADDAYRAIEDGVVAWLRGCAGVAAFGVGGNGETDASSG